MQSLLTVLIVVAVAVFVLVGLIASLSRGSVYDQIGGGGLSMDGGEREQATPTSPGSPAAEAEREQEIRQMLNARSERLVRQGGAPLDVDAELAALLEPGPNDPAADLTLPAKDAGIVEEVRELVIARNTRRARQGLQELDVDTEVARTLEELGA